MSESLEHVRSVEPSAEAAHGLRVLTITPCHNDGWAVEGLAAALRRQTVPVLDWVIVDDASTDDTAATLGRVRDDVPFASVLRRDRPPGRRIGEKANAVNAGYDLMRTRRAYDAVAILDADVLIPDDYFERVAVALADDPDLGVCGGVYLEPGAAPSQAGRAAGAHVPGPAQVFRREVFEAVGGYSPLPFGGDDVESVTRARLLGWRTAALHSVTYSHRRRMGTGGHGSAIRADFNLGRQDHDLGTWLPFETVKLARHMTRRPFLFAGAARSAGFVEATIRRRPRSVDDDYVSFARAEQRDRLARPIRRALTVTGQTARRVRSASGADRGA
jgi:poly-beta-1,6-N-acetyl-D-glucosamine synthase